MKSIAFRLSIAAVLLLTAFLSRTAPTSATLDPVAKDDFSVNFGDFQSQAELTYPASTNSPSSTIILIHGGGAADMNFDIQTGSSCSHIFLDIAYYFAPRGIAVLRYNKHYVTSATQVDNQSYNKITMPILLSDAEKVLQAAESNPHVDAKHIFIYGWSEGSTIAAALAAKHPEVAGLILQGTVARSWKDTFAYQINSVVVPYALTFSSVGKVNADALTKALAGNGGPVAKGEVTFLLDTSIYYTTQKVAVNPALDSNKDGELTAAEVSANIGPLLNASFSPGAQFAIYAAATALRGTTAQAPNIKQATLLLQGQNDASLPPDGATETYAALTNAADRDIKTYTGLGHTLGPASSVIDDNFRPIAEPPMADTVAWVKAQLSPTAPPTNTQGAVSNTPMVTAATPTVGPSAPTATFPISGSTPVVPTTSSSDNGLLIALIVVIVVVVAGLLVFIRRRRVGGTLSTLPVDKWKID